jgi:hypothetical protein
MALCADLMVEFVWKARHGKISEDFASHFELSASDVA